VQDLRAVTEHRRTADRDMEPARFDLGQRADQVRRRVAFDRGKPLYFVQEFVVGEA
jgi:hypothetical protein